MKKIHKGKPVRPHSEFLRSFFVEHNLRYGAEIGIWIGNTTVYLLDTIHDLRLVAVDSWQGPNTKNKDVFITRIDDIKDRLNILHMTSDVACQKIDDHSLDFVFIDADHTYPAVKSDIINWAPKVRPGGYLMGHDRKHKGVARALSELVPRHDIGDGGCWYINMTPELEKSITKTSEGNGMRGWEAFNKLIAMDGWKTVLDIGSGPGIHLKKFKAAGKTVFSCDKKEGVDYFDYKPAQPFDAIWCCHVLEHTRNPGLFLDKMFSDLKENGILAITVPPATDHVVSGHLTYWSEMMLLYHLVMAGFDCSRVWIERYTHKKPGGGEGRNISVVLKKKSADLPGMCGTPQDLFETSHYFPVQYARHR